MSSCTSSHTTGSLANGSTRSMSATSKTCQGPDSPTFVRRESAFAAAFDASVSAM